MFLKHLLCADKFYMLCQKQFNTEEWIDRYNWNMNKLIWVVPQTETIITCMELSLGKRVWNLLCYPQIYHLQHEDIILKQSGCVHSLAILTNFLRCQLKFDYQITIIIIVAMIGAPKMKVLN